MSSTKEAIQYIFFLFAFSLLHFRLGPQLKLKGDGSRFFIDHAMLQTVLFFFAAMIPAYIYKVMWFVDIAWPVGLMCISIYNFFILAETWKAWLICGCVFFQGFRMFLGGCFLVTTGRWKVDKDIQRYEYQKIRQEKKHGPGSFNMMFIQKEIFLQAIANFVFLILPVTLVCNDSEASMSSLEMFGFVIWLCSYALEAIADQQKMNFIAKSAKEGKRGQVCNRGLWYYSRHPNYFGEWMVWNSLIIVSLTSVYNLNLDLVSKSFITMNLLALSYTMWICLTVWTGAKPAEYFSVLKRESYKEY